MSDMSEEQVTIASAVIVPHEGEVDASPPGRLTKRRQSSLSPESAKRARLNHNDRSSSSTKYGDGDGGKLQPGAATAADIKAEEKTEVKAESDDESSRASRRPPRRAAGKDEERKRGKRLFGALLGTIGKFQQDSSSARARTSAVKRREVEAKLQEKLKQQTDEIDERRKKEDQNINLRRKMEQRIFDERAMQIRHANVLAQANILSTAALPKLFYLPWKLLPAEEGRIKVQIEEAEDTITQEQREFQLRREREEEDEQLNGGANNLNEPDLVTDLHHEDDISPVIGADDGNDHGEAETVKPENDDGDHTNLDNAPILDEGLEASNVRRQSDVGDMGDIVVETGEDTVIY